MRKNLQLSTLFTIARATRNVSLVKDLVGKEDRGSYEEEGKSLRTTSRSPKGGEFTKTGLSKAKDHRRSLKNLLSKT